MAINGNPILSIEQRRQWDEDGYFIIRGFSEADAGHEMQAEIIDLLRADPPEAHQNEPAYLIDGDLMVQPEAKPNSTASHPEDKVSKIFNAHLVGAAKTFAHEDRTSAIVGELLGPDIDVFQTQFILKNPGAWGQPWHQDSFYFQYEKQPQVGLWLAITRATIENGCLYVLSGSHKGGIHEHHVDERAGANQGYLEIRDVDFSDAIPVTMEPGDLLVFHSYLMHKSTDNVADERRAAMVYHYGRAGSVNEAPEQLRQLQEMFTRWVPVRRNGKRVAA